MKKVELTPEMIQALLALCDGVPLRGPESKILVAGAQAALMEALREGQPYGSSGRTASATGPGARAADSASGPNRPPGGSQS